MPNPPLNHVPKCHIYTSFTSLQGCWFHHFPGQLVWMIGRFLLKDFFLISILSFSTGWAFPNSFALLFFCPHKYNCLLEDLKWWKERSWQGGMLPCSETRVQRQHLLQLWKRTPNFNSHKRFWDSNLSKTCQDKEKHMATAAWMLIWIQVFGHTPLGCIINV